MFNFSPLIFKAPDTTGVGAGGGGGLGIGADLNEAISAVQTGVNLVNSIGAKKRLNKLIDQLSTYTTPDAFYQGLNLTENKAQGDTITRDYQTNILDNMFGDYLSGAVKLGADPNELSAAFGQKIQGLMQVGEQFHQSNTEAFSAMLNGFNALAENKTAEWASKNNRIKDKIQAENANFKSATEGMNNGINSLMSTISDQQLAKLYAMTNGKTDSSMPIGSRVSVSPAESLVPAMVNSTSYINPNP